MFNFIGKGKQPPKIPSFVKEQLEWDGSLSDMQLMDKFANRHCKGWRPSSTAKKLESLRKTLWDMKKKGVIVEISRDRLSVCSDEIYYRLND